MTANTPGTPSGARPGPGPHGTGTPPVRGVPRQRGPLSPDELPERPAPPDTHR